MFINLGIVEILVILFIAYLVLGPKRLPKIAKKVGNAIKKISKETDGLSKEIKEIKETVTSVSDKVKK